MSMAEKLLFEFFGGRHIEFIRFTALNTSFVDHSKQNERTGPPLEIYRLYTHLYKEY